MMMMMMMMMMIIIIINNNNNNNENEKIWNGCDITTQTTVVSKIPAGNK